MMNIFRVVASGKHAFREEFVSAFLAYLLSPKMDHGLGYSFLAKLLGSVAEHPSSHDIRTLAGRMKNCLWESVFEPTDAYTTVELEFKYGSGFIDIVVRFGEWFIMIENKIVGASKKADQVKEQYVGLLDALKEQEQFPNPRILVLYLVPATFNGENWTVNHSFHEELEKVDLREGDRKALVSWQPTAGDDSQIPSIVGILREILRAESEGMFPPIGTEIRHALLSLIDFSLGEFQGFHYEETTTRKSAAQKTKVRDVMGMDGELFVGVRYGRGGTAYDAWRNPGFLDREVALTENPNLGWQYVPLKDFKKIARWAIDPENNDLDGLEWTGTPFGPDTLCRIGRWGKTNKFFIGIKGGVEALKNMAEDEIRSRTVWQVNSKKKNSSWINAEEFSEILESKGIIFE